MVLFTRDLRVHDHPALWEACRVTDDVVPLFVVDPQLMAISPNRARFLAECLAGLDASLQKRGGRLFVRTGDVATEVARAVADMDCKAVYMTRDVGAFASDRDARLDRALIANGCHPARAFPGHAAIEPGELVPRGRGCYRVFTPYLRAWWERDLRALLPAPRTIPVRVGMGGGRLPDPARYHPTATDLPPGGEVFGRKRLRSFLSRDASEYGESRNELGRDATSRLSPYLRFGCVSPVEAVAHLRGVVGAEEFVRQIAWRDFFLQLRAEVPSMTWQDMRAGGASPVPLDAGALEAWITGRTGVPIVDAGMRQLQREGWMHNRARLVAASFLTRRMGVPWQEGARHFMHHLVDGDPSSNAGNWQWAAGTGVAPRRGRPLDPVRQAHRFDHDGVYVRRYVGELERCDGDRLFRPWRHEEILRATGYPAPIVDLPD